MRTISDVGEFGLIARIERRLGGRRWRQVLVGPGDDAAVVRPREGEDLVVSTDCLVEGVHFRFANQSSGRIGRRALRVNLSDLAAMGARPLGCTVGFAAPAELPLGRFDGLVDGLVAESERSGCPLLGGNVAAARETSLAITVLGAVAAGRALLRGRARPGDRIFVTGHLGGAALALARAERLGRALRRLPEPRLAAGRALARMRARISCIDVSDGLAADLAHLLAGCRAGAEIDARRLPRPRGFERACAALRLDAATVLASGGEDYELLFTLPAGPPGAVVLSRRLAVPVTEIGRVTRRPGIRGLPRTGGYTHF